MADQPLFKFLKQQKRAVQVNHPNLAQERNEWVADLQALMEQIRKWLEPAFEHGLLNVSWVERGFDEDIFGPYRAPTLELRAPSGQKVSITPGGLQTVGARGRVDIESGPRKVWILRLEKGHWVLAFPQPGQAPAQKKLTEKAFSETLRQLLAP